MLKESLVIPEADRVEELRDAALWVLERHGQWRPCGSRRLYMLTAIVNDLLILHRTPFQKLLKLSEEMKYLAALRGDRPADKRYSLDIWHGKKVFGIEWNDAQETEVRAFRQGEWVDKLLALRSGITT